MTSEKSEGTSEDKGELHERDLRVLVHDEDTGGKPIRIEAEPEWTVGHVIKELYSRLNTAQQAGDRLRCEGNGQDVFTHADERLEAYARQHCHSLVWLYTRQTGGA